MDSVSHITSFFKPIGSDIMNGYIIVCLYFESTYTSLAFLIRYHRCSSYSYVILRKFTNKTSFLNCLDFFFVSLNHRVFSAPNELLMSCQLLMQIEKETDTEELIEIQLKCDTD
jgi:hypothetical protein